MQITISLDVSLNNLSFVGLRVIFMSSAGDSAVMVSLGCIPLCLPILGLTSEPGRMVLRGQEGQSPEG